MQSYLDRLRSRIKRHKRRGLDPPFDLLHDPCCPWSVKHRRCTCTPTIIYLEDLLTDYDIWIDGEGVAVRLKADAHVRRRPAGEQLGAAAVTGKQLVVAAVAGDRANQLTRNARSRRPT